MRRSSVRTCIESAPDSAASNGRKACRCARPSCTRPIAGKHHAELVGGVAIQRILQLGTGKEVRQVFDGLIDVSDLGVADAGSIGHPRLRSSARVMGKVRGGW